MRDLAYVLALIALLALGGERESELRARLENEREFAESVAIETDALLSELSED